MKTTSLLAVSAIVALGACGGSTSTETIVDMTTQLGNGAVVTDTGSITAEPDGTFTITQGSREITLPASNVFINGQKAWQTGFNGGRINANSFITDDVSAIGGVNGEGTAFSGITGDLAAAPTGDAAFAGRYAVNASGSSQSGVLEMTYDMSANTLDSDAGSTFVVDGDVASNGEVTGTISFGTDTADFEGGFYGDDAVAGAFNSATIGGVFYGTN